MKEYLVTLDDEAFGAASDVVPKFASPSDPAAQWTGAMRGPAFFAYADNYLIDVKFGIIMDVEATRAIRQAEFGAAKTMIERTEERFDIKPAYLCRDPQLDRQCEEDRAAYSGHRQVMPSRRIARDVNEAARDVARALVKTEAFERSRRHRKRVEILFAHLKRILKLERLRLRGPCGAR
jgi:hypothetical protein